MSNSLQLHCDTSKSMLEIKLLDKTSTQTTVSISLLPHYQCRHHDNTYPRKHSQPNVTHHSMILYTVTNKPSQYFSPTT
jgi:hypothetical protein